MKGCFGFLTRKKKEIFTCKVCGFQFYKQDELDSHHEDHLENDTTGSYGFWSKISLG